MAGIEKRLERLEERVQPPEEDKEAKEVWRALFAATSDEVGRLRGARSNSGYRGGNPPTPIQPTDAAGEALGYPYTLGQLQELAIERVWEREGLPEDLMEDWKDHYRALGERIGIDRDKVVAYGPPEPTPPWHQRYRHGT